MQKALGYAEVVLCSGGQDMTVVKPFPSVEMPLSNQFQPRSKRGKVALVTETEGTGKIRKLHKQESPLKPDRRESSRTV